MIKEMLKKYRFYELSSTLRYNPSALDSETTQKLRAIQEILQDQSFLSYRGNSLLILKLHLEEGLTLEQIAEKLNISTRHAERLKAQAVETICRVLEPRP